MSKIKSKNAADILYTAEYKAVLENLEKLNQQVIAHKLEQEKYPNDYRFVGDLTYINNKLFEVVDFLS